MTYLRCLSVPTAQSRRRGLCCLHHSDCGLLIDVVALRTFEYHRAGPIVMAQSSAAAVTMTVQSGAPSAQRYRIDRTRQAHHRASWRSC